MEPFDPTRPNVARVWDYWLGGKDNFAADRELAEPACVILSAILHFTDAGNARDVAAAFARAVVPGSYLIISCGSGSRSEGENFTSEYTAARVYIHSAEEIRSFFDGLDLVPPGVVAVRRWSGDGPDLGLGAPSATFIGGVARKP